MSLGSAMEDTYGKRWDRISDSEPFDAGTFGEDARGVWATQHPLTAYADRPRLVRPVEMFRMGVHAITPDMIATLSSFEIDCLIELISAHNRAQHPEQEAKDG